MVEARDTLLNSQLGEPIARFSDENWQQAKKAFLTQNPFLTRWVIPEPRPTPVA